MRAIIAILVLSLLLASCATPGGGRTIGSSPGQPIYVIKVTSPTNGLPFSGVIATANPDGTTASEDVEAKTPQTYRAQGAYLSAGFTKRTDAGTLQLAVYDAQTNALLKQKETSEPFGSISIEVSHGVAQP